MAEQIVGVKRARLSFAIVIAFLFLLAAPLVAGATVRLQIFDHLRIDVPNPIDIVHNDSVLFRYGKWAFSEEIVDPETGFRGIDLSGWTPRFFESLFKPDLRQSLPAWMSTFSEEVASEYDIKADNWREKAIHEFKIYSIYDARIDQFDYFIIAKDSVATIQCSKDKQKCSQLFNRFAYTK